MGRRPPEPVSGWIQDPKSLLYHFYQEQPGLEAHRPLCEGPVLLTQSLRRHVGPLPAELKPRYGASKPQRMRLDGICLACTNRHAKLN